MQRTYFELFGLPAVFNIDLKHLDQVFRQLQTEVHPDRFVAAPDSERRQSLQWASHANEAYQTLKNPLMRARYLLQLHGIDTQEESNTAMPVDFLMQQMEWREAIEEATSARDIGALDILGRELRQASRDMQNSLSASLDEQGDYLQASDTVRKLRFLDKVLTEIDYAIETLES